MIALLMAATLAQLQAPMADAPPAQDTTSTPLSISLVCRGGGERIRTEGAQLFGFDNHGNSANAFGTRQRFHDYGDVVMVQISDGVGRMHVPASLVPPMHGGGQDGWWTIQRIKVDDATISGRVSFNVLDSPSFVIDRTSGQISLNGHRGTFNGTCEPFKVEQRKF